MGEYQFEKNKKGLIKKIIKSLDNESTEEHFSILFDKKCQEYNISFREKEIMLLLFEGIQYKEIADRLYISVNTVRAHVRNIYDKCEVKSKIALMNIFNIK